MNFASYAPEIIVAIIGITTLVLMIQIALRVGGKLGKAFKAYAVALTFVSLGLAFRAYLKFTGGDLSVGIFITELADYVGVTLALIGTLFAKKAFSMKH